MVLGAGFWASAVSAQALKAYRLGSDRQLPV